METGDTNIYMYQLMRKT